METIKHSGGVYLNYAHARAIGPVGECRVADVLRSEAPPLGYQLLNNLLLVDDQTTAQLDHVLVDRFGILVVESKDYYALIKGKSGDKCWTAHQSGSSSRAERFLNPLRQNDRHRETLHRVLGASGRSLPAGYVQSLIIFAGGDLSNLGLNDADAMRVIPSREAVDYLRARCGDFQPNPGTLDSEHVADLVSLLRSVNQAGNPEAVSAHERNVSRATRRFAGFFLPRRPDRPATPAGPYGGYRTYNQSSRYPDGSIGDTLRRRSGMAVLLKQLVGALVVLIVGWWVFIGGGIALLQPVQNYLISVTSGGDAGC